MKMEDRFEGSTVQIFAVVDLEAGVAYALKVGILNISESFETSICMQLALC